MHNLTRFCGHEDIKIPWIHLSVNNEKSANTAMEILPWYSGGGGGGPPGILAEMPQDMDT